MRKTFITFLATAALVTPALAAPNLPKYQPPQPQAQANQQASNQQTVSPSSLSRDEIRQMQTALNNDGFNVGQPDGKWGPRTRAAVQKFDQSKGIQTSQGLCP